MASHIFILSIAISLAVLLQCGVEAAHHNGTRHVRHIKNTHTYGGGNGDAGSDSASDSGQSPLSVGYVNGGGDAAQAPTPDAPEMAIPDQQVGVPDAITNAADVVQNAISNAATQVGTSGLGGAADTVGGKIGSAGNEVTNAINNAADLIGNNGIGGAADEVGIEIKDGAGQIASAIRDAANQLEPYGFNGGPNQIVNAIGGAENGLKDAINNAANRVVNSLHNKYGDDFFRRYPFYDQNVAANHKVIHTINGVADQLLNAIQAAANQVATAVGTAVPPPAPVPQAPEVDPGFNRQIEYIPEAPQDTYKTKYVGIDPGFNVDSDFGVDPGFNENPDFTHVITV